MVVHLYINTIKVTEFFKKEVHSLVEDTSDKQVILKQCGENNVSVMRAKKRTRPRLGVRVWMGTLCGRNVHGQLSVTASESWPKTRSAFLKHRVAFLEGLSTDPGTYMFTADS